MTESHSSPPSFFALICHVVAYLGTPEDGLPALNNKGSKQNRITSEALELKCIGLSFLGVGGSKGRCSKEQDSSRGGQA